MMMKNYSINKKNSLIKINYSKATFLALIIITSLFATVVPLQQSFSSEFTYSVSSGSNTLTFRDITDTNPTPEPDLLFDAPIYQPGETAILTIDDFNANLAVTIIEFASAVIVQTSSSTTVNAEETGVSTHFFIGDFLITDNINLITTTSTEATPNAFLSYTPAPPESARVSVTVDLSSGGDVTISDFEIDDNELVNLCFRPVTHAAEISFSNGAAQTGGTDMEVTLSYANAIFLSGDSPALLKMYYREPGQGFEVVRDNFNSEGFETVLPNTITSVPDQGLGIFIGDVTEGQFVLGFETGCGGGGGGGLVRPGLVVNILAGSSAIGGGGGGPPGPTITLGALALNDNAVETISMPQEIRDIALAHDPHTPLEPITDVYEDYDFPLSINGNGFVLGGYENTLVPQTVNPGEPIEFTLVFYTTSEIAHTSLNFNLGQTRTIAGSDTQVLLYKDKFEIIDPNGNIAFATGSLNNEGDLKRVATFSITFSEDIQWSNSDLVIRTWNDNLNSGDTIVYDAIQVAPSVEEIAFEESLPEPEVEQLKSQYVPIWIKNNAAWWSQELIDDSDFVAGIEYLIQNEIITIQDNQVIASSYSSDEIPEWIKNNAGWWSEDLITEKEFIDGLQWLISNGIIQVTET